MQSLWNLQLGYKIEVLLKLNSQKKRLSHKLANDSAPIVSLFSSLVRETWL